MTDEDIFAGFKSEGETDPFAELEKGTDKPAESQTEKEVKSDETQQGENTDKKDESEDEDYHKRWAKREAKLKEEMSAQFQAEIQKSRDEYETKLASLAKGGEKIEAPAFLTDMVGDNPEVAAKFRTYEEQLSEKIRNDILISQQQAQQQFQAEQQRWNGWVDGELSKLKAEGEQFDRDELIKTLLEYKPTDENNNFDFKAGLKILKMSKAEETKLAEDKTTARKKIADTTTSKSSGGSDKTGTGAMTSADLRNKSWTKLVS